MLFKDELIEKFTKKPGFRLSEKFTNYACVAVLLRGSSFADLEVGYIVRAQNPSDNWSGHIAFVGGRGESSDADDFYTIVRETREEIGIILHRSDLIAELDDMQGRKSGKLLDFFIRPFVFHLEKDPPLKLDPLEVEEFFWIKYKYLKDPSWQTVYQLDRDGVSLELPATRVGKKPVLWGLSYMITQNLIERLES